MARSTPHDALLPRQPGGMAPGAALAVLAHLGLLFALTAAVDWRLRKPELTASAELWASVPQAAAPRAVEPAPVPPSVAPPAPTPAPAPKPAPAPTPPVPKAEAQREDADIALERERRDQQLQAQRDKATAAREKKEQREQEQRELEAQKTAQKKREAAEAEAARRLADAEALKKKREADAREAKAEEARLAQQREDNLKRILGQAGATGGPNATGSAATDAGPSASYAGKLVALVRPNIVFTGSAEANAAAEVEVRAGASGSIISRRLLKASGQPDWDEAVLRAIDKTARLPRDTDGRIPPVIVMVFKPRE